MHVVQRCVLLLLCVCLLDTAMSCAKTAKPIEMSFVLCTGGPKEPLISCGPHPLGDWGRGNFVAHILAY